MFSPALLFGALQPLKAAQHPSLPKAIERVDALVTTELASDNIGGITIGIVSGGQLVWTKSYGYADVARKTPLARHHVFAIASITKQFTALMLLQLVEQGVVRLSDPVDKYLPEVRMLRRGLLAATPSVTLAQLATHTSGLDRNGDDDQNVYGVGPVSEWEHNCWRQFRSRGSFMNLVAATRTPTWGTRFWQWPSRARPACRMSNMFRTAS